MPRALKSTAKLWPQSKTLGTKYRDRKRVRLPDGTGKEVYGYGSTKQAATEDLYRKVEAVTREEVRAETITVTQLFAEFVQHKRSVRGNKAKTIHDDLGMFTRHIQPVIGERALADVTLSDLQAIQHSLTSKGKWRSAERCTILLKALLSFATKRYRAELAAGRLTLVLRDDLDNIKRPPGTKREVNPLWTLNQVKAFLALAETQYNAHPRNIMYPLFYTALEAGLRRGELLGLGRSALKNIVIRGRVQHYLEITEQLIEYGGSLHHDTPKTPSSVRKIPITEKLAGVLKQHMVRMDHAAERESYGTNDLMFPSWNGTPLTTRNLNRAKDALIETLGLTRLTFHEMRKAATTHFTAQLIRDGVYSPKLVSKRLGHTQSAVALEVYTLLNQDDYMASTLSLEAAAGTAAGMALTNEQKEEDAEF